MLFRIFPHSPIPIWKSFALPSQVWGGNGRLFAEAHGGTYLHEPTQPDSLQDPKGLHRILTKLLLDQMADGAWQNVKIDKHIPYSSYFKGVEASSSQWNPNCWRPSFGWGHGSKCILSLWRWWDHLPGPLAESWTNGNGADFWIRFPKLDPSGRLSAADCTWHRRQRSIFCGDMASRCSGSSPCCIVPSVRSRRRQIGEVVDCAFSGALSCGRIDWVVVHFLWSILHCEAGSL